MKTWQDPGLNQEHQVLEHRIGGLEKANIKGTVSYDPDNHDVMVKLRAEKVKKVVQDVPDLTVDGDPFR
jgi:2-oxoglutarate/2-oxoacid ferredoxin oxidoreductase subunit alpha